MSSGDIFGGMLSAATGGLWDIWMQERQYDQNKHFQRVANEFTLDMWNRNNEYNKPINQMARLREAGLNPQLAMGGSSIMNTSSMVNQGVSGSSSYQSHLDMSKIFKDVSEAKLAEEQQKQTKANTEVLDTVAHNNREQAKLLREQILSQKLDNIAKGLNNKITSFKVNTGLVGDDALSNVGRSVLGSITSFKDWANKKVQKLLSLPDGDLEEIYKNINKKGLKNGK